MLIYCFEDDGVGKLAPITHARPAYAITCAGYRLIDWLNILRRETQDCHLAGEVRPYLNGIQREDYGIDDAAPSLVGTGTSTVSRHDVLLVNARLVPSVSNYRSLRALMQIQRATVIVSDTDKPGTDFELNSPRRGASHTVLAAWLPAAEVAAAITRAAAARGSTAASALSQSFPGHLEQATGQASGTPAPPGDEKYRILCHHAVSTAARSDLPLSEFRWPHDVVSAHMQCMNESTQYRIAISDYTQLQDGVFVGKDVSIGEYECIRTDGGPIILEDNVKVGPFCFLEGPLYAGANTRVIEHSSLKDGVSLGHTAKIGGEVEASVIESYSNKQHHGFLGHSYLGSWINLGAGTCNSDLKNTYGKINMQYGDEKVSTAMQFLGCIIGDYSKSAINTGIFTGKVIGVCSMMYGFVTGNVPSYVNYARLFGQTSLLPPEIMVNTQARMFARRNVTQRPVDIALIHAMYHNTECERQSSDQLGY